ncbi:hypothetical protein, partial [Escherichia coli]|uniref:hypothetical protein n=1 Tax=Escherichia coli TaxID=562 RepID=UPI00200F80D3
GLFSPWTSPWLQDGIWSPWQPQVNVLNPPNKSIESFLKFSHGRLLIVSYFHSPILLALHTPENNKDPHKHSPHMFHSKDEHSNTQFVSEILLFKEFSKVLRRLSSKHTRKLEFLKNYFDSKRGGLNKL